MWRAGLVPASRRWRRGTGRGPRRVHRVSSRVEVPEALLGLANACYWLGDLPGMMQSLERAYAAARAAPTRCWPPLPALSLVGYHKQFFGNMAAARGWLARAARIVESRGAAVAGELLGATSFVTDDPVESERLAREVLAIGRADGNADLELLAMTAVGGALVQQGRMAEGMALLDEAMAAAFGGECGDPLTAAHASCMTMLVCSSHFDIERATQWLQAMDRFIGRYGCPFLYAECRTHYGRVLFENGDWAAAEKFLTEAIAMSRGITPASHALASGTLAELRLAQGRLEDAARVLEGLEGRDEAVAAVGCSPARNEPSLAAASLRRRVDAVGKRPARPRRGDRAPRPGRDHAGGPRDARPGVPRAHRARRRQRLPSDRRLRRGGCSAMRWPPLTWPGLRAAGAALPAFTQAEIPYRAAQTRLSLAGTLSPIRR